MDSTQARHRVRTVQDLPDEALERILARVPTVQARVSAAAVCRAWRQLLADRNLRLWQAVSIGHQDKWDTAIGEHGYPDRDDRDGSLVADRVRLLLALQRWLWRRGGGLLQLQCSTAFNTNGMAEDGLLTAMLAALPAAAPSLQGLRVDGAAAAGMTNSSLVGIAGMGDRLRQLALIGLWHASDASLMAALAQLPLLQDLAIMFVDEEDKDEALQWTQSRKPKYPQPDILRLLDHAAASCPALRTLALGYLPNRAHHQPWGDVTRNARPLPASMSRLTALSSLALHDVGWEYTPEGLPDLPQLRRLSLRGDCRMPGILHPALPHQLKTLTSLQALQVTLPRWVGRLPAGLTQLVMSPYRQRQVAPEVADGRALDAAVFFRSLPLLRGLRHLAFHRLPEIGEDFLQEVCAAAAALPRLISLHLVRCSVSALPGALCELSRLQLLNLSHNEALHADGCRSLAQSPLHKLTSCRWLDLRCATRVFMRVVPLQPDTIAALAGMPALEHLALPPTVPHQPHGLDGVPEDILGLLAPPVQLDIPSVYTDGNLTIGETEVALLAQHRKPGMPPIRVAADMPTSDSWAAVSVDLPFAEVNDVLGVQLDRSIMRGVPH